MSGTLFVVSTPIGNLDDITFRALKILKEVDIIAAEDTRRTRALLSHFDIHTKLISYHQHNESKRANELIALLKDGRDIAVVTDAGTPGISDPGRVLVEKAFLNDIKVCPIPGASAVTTALSVCPFLYDRYLFYGFLPSKKGELKKALNNLKDRREVLVFFISPHKINIIFEVLCSFFSARRALLARELTKVYETIVVDEICNIFNKIKNGLEIKGEVTLIIEGNREDKDMFTDLARLESHNIFLLLEILFKKGLSSKDIVELLTEVFNLKKKMAYNLVNRFREDER